MWVKLRASQVDRYRTSQGSQEQTLSTEYHGLQVSGPLDVVLNALGKRRQATRIHAKNFAVELTLDHRAADVHESLAISAQMLKDESLATEETTAELSLKSDIDLCAECGTQERVFLAIQLASQVGHIQRNYLSGVGGCKGDTLLAVPGIREVRHEDGLAGQYTFAHMHQ